MLLKFAKWNFDKFQNEYFWAFDKTWNQEFDGATSAHRFNQLMNCLKHAIATTPQEFPLWWILAVPEDIEELFAKLTTKTDRRSLHHSLQQMTSDEQEKVVKSLIKFWCKKAPATVPIEHQQYAGITKTKPKVVPHGAIADPVLPIPIVKDSPINPNSLNILLGESTATKKQIFWTPNKETNGFCLTIGASGSGKTETLKAIAKEAIQYGIPSLIIDFHGDIALPECKDIVLSHTAACEYGINPLELDSLDPINGGVFPQVQKLLESISNFNTAIGHKQRLNIEKYIFEAYGDRGITDDNPDSWQFAPPTFADVIRLMEDGNSDALSALAVVKSVFAHPVFNKASRLDIESLLAESHRINLSALTDNIQFLAVDTILRKIGCALIAKGHIPIKCQDCDRYRLMVVMDEAHKFTSKATNRKGIIDVFACELRKFGLMMALGSQNLDHFSPDTISQVATKILLKLQSAESARFPSSEFGLTVDAITKGLRGKGHGYLKRGSSTPIEIQIAPLHQR